MKKIILALCLIPLSSILEGTAFIVSNDVDRAQAKRFGLYLLINHANQQEKSCQQHILNIPYGTKRRFNTDKFGFFSSTECCVESIEIGKIDTQNNHKRIPVYTATAKDLNAIGKAYEAKGLQTGGNNCTGYFVIEVDGNFNVTFE